MALEQILARNGNRVLDVQISVPSGSTSMVAANGSSGNTWKSLEIRFSRLIVRPVAPKGRVQQN
jgi:hypothetical protein